MPAIERLIASSPQGALLGGLLWRAPSAGRSRARALQEARALTTDATHYVQVQAESHRRLAGELQTRATASRLPDDGGRDGAAAATVASHLRFGMYQPRVSEEGLQLPRATFAAAACFARLVGARAPNAALVLGVAAAGSRKEDRYFVVCLDDGVPAIDVLSNEVDARNALGGEDRPIWSDNPLAYPNCEPADFAWLAGGMDRTTRVQAIPMDPWPLVAAACVLAVAAGAWFAAHGLHRAAATREAEAAARAADPVPRYLAALAAQESTMASDRKDLAAAATAMFAWPVHVPGWRLVAAQCDARRQTCTRDWARKGGSFDDLRRALPGDALELVTAPGGTLPALDLARTSQARRIGRVDLLRTAWRPRSLSVALTEAGPLLQSWRTADVMLDLKRPAPWPRVAGLPRAFAHPRALLAGEAALQDVPGPFIVEALRSAPDFISWESVRVDVGEGGDPKGLLRFSATGVFYVAPN